MKNKYQSAMDRMLSASNKVSSLASTNPRIREKQIEEMKERAENR